MLFNAPRQPCADIYDVWVNNGWIFLGEVRFFQTSIMEHLVVILKTTLRPQNMFFIIFNVMLIINTIFNAHGNQSAWFLIKYNWSKHRWSLFVSAKMVLSLCDCKTLQARLLISVENCVIIWDWLKPCSMQIPRQICYESNNHNMRKVLWRHFSTSASD